MTQMTDSFITQAEEAIAWIDKIESTGLGSSGAEQAARDALRSLLGEYKRLTTEGEWEYAWLDDRESAPVVSGYMAGREIGILPSVLPWKALPDMEPVRRRPAGPWVPVEGEDQ